MADLNFLQLYFMDDEKEREDLCPCDAITITQLRKGKLQRFLDTQISSIIKNSAKAI